MLDSYLKLVGSLNISTGANIVVSDNGRGGGEILDGIYGMAYQASFDRFYVTTPNAWEMRLVDRITGDRSALSDLNHANQVKMSPSGTYLYLTRYDVGDSQFIDMLRWNLTTGASTSFSAFGSGAENILDFYPKSTDDKVYGTSWVGTPGLYEISTTTGVMTLTSVGAGPAFTGPVGVTLNQAETIAYVTDTSLGAIVAVTLATGNRSTVSSGSVGSGTSFSSPVRIVVDQAGTYAYVSDDALDAIFRVEIATGNRVILSDASTGTGLNFSIPATVSLDEARGKLYVQDSGLKAILAVDLVTGNRTLVTR